ncbi:ATP-binding protein [Stackebrandtia soli]|uniref:ATP-binding protein n=1 Tax=Stackebrandtia soli TaxID=1892856 RepID=UPI0039EB9D65
MTTPPTPARMCDDHPGQTWIYCGPCRADALVSGNPEAVIAWHARRQVDELAERVPARFAHATATVPGVRAWLDRWHRDPADCPSLLLVGPVGVGKTWQAFGAVREAVTGPNSTSWMAVGAADLYASVRPRDGRDSESLMEQYRDVGLLLLDDLGTANRSEWVEEITYRVIGARYDAMRPCIFTSNIAPTQVSEALGERIGSRLAETCMTVVMDGADRRREVRA